MYYQYELLPPSKDDIVVFYQKITKDFYNSDAWKRLRYLTIKKYGAHCQACGCGRRASAENPIQVDHIKPVSQYPWLRLNPDNLQILCRDCNIGKGNIDQTDWREHGNAHSP